MQKIQQRVRAAPILLAPIIVEQLSEKIVSINQLGVTIFLVEQNAAIALAVAMHGNFSGNGRIVLADTTASVSNHPLAKEVCLGS